jgi:charged multivesicular body protein 1
MDRFESQFEDMDVQTGYMENAMGDTTALSTPQDQVDLLLNQVRSLTLDLCVTD